MTEDELKNKGWQLVADATRQIHWRDPLPYSFDLAIKTQEDRDESLHSVDDKK